MLFRRAFFCFSALTLAVAALSFFSHVHLRASDIPQYRRLIRESALRTRRALERHPAHQMREGVQKDIWAVNGTERLHFRLNSAHSELTLTQKKDKVEAVEELQKIQCVLQEKIDSVGQTQQVRAITAAEGTYFYPSHRFAAHTVHLALYRIPGVKLPLSFLEKPFLTGVAKEATFAATSKIPTFTAYNITAQLDPEKGLP